MNKVNFNVASLLTDVENMQAEMQKVQLQFRTALTEKFNELVRGFFPVAPNIKAVGWTQYTPYFNDGEECVFGVGDVWICSTDDADELSEVSYGCYDGDGEVTAMEASAYLSTHAWHAEERAAFNEGLTPEQVQQQRTAVKTFAQIVDCNSDLMKAMFGDHVKVVITKDGVEVEEFDHD